LTRTLVVSAFEPEIEPLRRLVRGARGIVLAPVGIGAIDAAVGAARAIAAARPTQVVFVGTAGIYGSAKLAGAAIGTVAVAGDIFCVSTAALRSEAYLPAPTILRGETSRRLRTALLAGTPGSTGPVAVACPLAITRSVALGRRIATATGATLENLEAFAVARAATAAGVEYGAVLGVANRVAPTGHDEWRRHHHAASDATCRLVARWLGLAPRS
jgi:nucleoside phosphorylase